MYKNNWKANRKTPEVSQDPQVILLDSVVGVAHKTQMSLLQISDSIEIIIHCAIKAWKKQEQKDTSVDR